MKKNILIISTSLRKGGNSEILASAFSEGAREAGHTVENVGLYNRDIQFCKGCLACQTTQKCIIQDDANDIVKRMIQSDVVVFATPIYFYEMCGQMKTLLDRSNPAFAENYKFRDIYLLATAADESEEAMEGAVQGLKGWIACFEKAKLSGVVRGTGVTAVGDIRKESIVLETAREMGKRVGI